MHSKPKIHLLLLACSCLVLAGCSQFGIGASEGASQSTSTPIPHGLLLITPTLTPSLPTGTVSIWHSLQDDELPALLRPIDAFRSANPGVQFDVTYVPSIDLRTAYEQAALQGKAPTVLIGDAAWGPALYDQGLVADLTPLVSTLLERLNPAGVETGRYKNALLSLPLYLEGIVLYRNGLLAPIAPATFDELVTFAQSATEGGAVGAMLDRGFSYSGAHLNGLGGKWINADGTPAFNDDKGLAWVSLLGAFEQAGPVEYQTDNDLNLFKEGRVGMITEDSRQRQNLAEAIGADNLAIDPWPVTSGGEALSGFVQAEGVFLNPRALQEDGQVSWEFVQTLFNPVSQAGLAQVGFIPAIDPAQLTGAGAEAKIDDPLITQAMAALAGGAAYPSQPQFSLYLPYLDIAIQSIFNGEASAADALQAAEDAILAELQNTPTP